MWGGYLRIDCQRGDGAVAAWRGGLLPPEYDHMREAEVVGADETAVVDLAGAGGVAGAAFVDVAGAGAGTAVVAGARAGYNATADNVRRGGEGGHARGERRACERNGRHARGWEPLASESDGNGAKGS